MSCSPNNILYHPLIYYSIYIGGLKYSIQSSHAWADLSKFWTGTDWENRTWNTGGEHKNGVFGFNIFGKRFLDYSGPRIGRSSYFGIHLLTFLWLQYLFPPHIPLFDSALDTQLFLTDLWLLAVASFVCLLLPDFFYCTNTSALISSRTCLTNLTSKRLYY